MRLEKNKKKLNAQDANDLIKAYEKVSSSIDPYVSEIKVQVNPKDTPVKIVHVGDTHFGHKHSDPEALDRAIEHAGDNGLLVSAGNLIEGTSTRSNMVKTTTAQTAIDAQQQTQIVKEKLKPLDDEGRVIPVSKNQCHEGWSAKYGAYDPTTEMVGGDTPVLISGGQIKFITQRGTPMGTLENYHSPGGGSTKQSPEGSLRRHSRETHDTHPDKPDALVQGHFHRQFAGQDVRTNPITSKDRTIAYGGVGTAKGSKKGPDDFLITIGVPPRNQPADTKEEGLMTIWRKKTDSKSKKTRLEPYPVAGYNRGGTIYNAFKLLENAERTGNADELVEEIKSSEAGKKPSAKKYNRRSSSINPSDYDPRAGKEPIHTYLSHNIKTELPISVQFIGGVRQGASFRNVEALSEVVGDIEENDWSFCYLTRRLINLGAAKQYEREDILEDLVDNFQNLRGRGLLGIMITDELLEKGWNDPIKAKFEDDVDRLAMNPGDYLNRTLGAPLMKPESITRLRLVESKKKRTDYLFFQVDRLRRYASAINPQHGHTRIHEMTGTNADLYVGGHIEEIGWRTLMKPDGHQLETMVPGGFSGFVEKGLHNEMAYPKGGQGVVLSSDKKEIYSFASHEDLKDGHRALWMRKGLLKLGKFEETQEKLQKSKTFKR